MRAVEVVKQKRNQLRNELAKFMNAKNVKYPTPTKYYDLEAYDRHEFSYIMGCISSLRNQINALEFVLNEDTELNDYTKPYPSQRDCGVSKEKVFEIALQDKIDNWFDN